jgi:GNAT superfamily N-acetyltransferase
MLKVSKTDMSFFPEAWRKKMEAYYGFIDLTSLVLNDKSGCVLMKFDGMCILYFLYTVPTERGKGLGRQVVTLASTNALPCPVFARYRKDEKHIEKLFNKAGYEVVHRGIDNFIVVASRML